jgi:hypothetical protein
MLAAVLLLAAVAPRHDVSAWIPARWYSHDPKSLELMRETPVNCLLLEQRDWEKPFVDEAGLRGIATLGVIHPEDRAEDAARRAAALGMTGVVLEGDFLESTASAVERSGTLTIRLPSRANLDLRAPLVGTYQGVWPGVQIQKDGVAVSAPSGSPWIDTNAGFLRFVRTVAGGPVWIANTPPRGAVLTAARYLQAIADAESAGAHWVIALDEDTSQRLLSGDAKALDLWRKMGELLRFYASHPEWRAMRPFSTLALLEDANSGAYLAGGIMDMLAAKHTTVRPVALRSMQPASMANATLAVNVDPAALTPTQQDALRAWTRAGNTLLTAPPGWKMPMPDDPKQISLNREQIARLGDIWRELNSLIGSRNPGGKVYNAPGAISNVIAAAVGRPVVVHLVNYTNYPMEDVTVRFTGRFSSAKLLAPGQPARDLEIFEEDGVTEITIPRFAVVAAVVME